MLVTIQLKTVQIRYLLPEIKQIQNYDNVNFDATFSYWVKDNNHIFKLENKRKLLEQIKKILRAAKSLKTG